MSAVVKDRPLPDARSRRFLMTEGGREVQDSGEAKRSEEFMSAREESERRFHTLFEKAPIGIVVATKDSPILAWNEAVVTTMGYSPDELSHLNLKDLYLDPEDGADLMERLRSDAQIRDHEAVLKHKDGSPYYARLSLSLVQYDGQEVLMTAIQDVTDRKRAADLLRLQRDIGIDLGSRTNLGEAFDYLLEAICTIEGIDCGGVYGVDSRTGNLDLLAHRGLSDEFVEIVSQFGPDTPNARIVMGGEPVYGRYPEMMPSMDGIHEREGLRGIAVIPVKYEGRVIAAANIASHTHDEIPEHARNALEAIAAGIGGELARLRVEDALRESDTQYRLLAENVSDVMWTIDMDLRSVLYVSPSIKNLTGFTPGEVKQMSLPEMLAPGDPEKAMAVFEQEMDKVKSGAFEPVTVELYMKCRDGATVITESTVSIVYDSSGTPMYILGVTRDISERKHLEDQLRQSAKMLAIGELAGGVAHEFNNMLTGILGYANMLRLTAEPGTTVHESARTIERAAERAADLTRKLLGFARRGRQRREAVNLHDTVREVVTLLRQTISENIHVSCELNSDDLLVTGDPGQIEQVLLNLALNSRDAMPSGGQLTISTGTVEVDASKVPEPDVKPGRYALLTVTDTGSGISRDNLQRIFEPFFTTKGHGRGTGMGLAMVYGTVRNHGGFTEVESRPGEATTFKVYFPMERCEALDEPGPEVDVAPHAGTGRILVIDDEDLVRDVARSMLEACGYDVVAFSNGHDAVEYYRGHGEKIDLVLIDMVMPEMSGRECFLALREMDPGVRAVLSTGYGADGEAREIVQEGMVGLVLKPFSKSALAKTVRDALSAEAVTLH
jgi:two-component system cell cycle sensor histidine kinase/response regulator CckA